MIVVMALEKWDGFEPVGGIPVGGIPVDIKVGKTIGFLPVYETLEDARADYPTAPVQEMRLRQDT